MAVFGVKTSLVEREKSCMPEVLGNVLKGGLYLTIVVYILSLFILKLNSCLEVGHEKDLYNLTNLIYITKAIIL